jgi:hypothetical protein
VPDFELPTPTIGAPPPEKLVADWLPVPPPNPLPLLLDPAPELTVDVPPGLVEVPPGPDVVEEPPVVPPIELPPGPDDEPIPGPSEKLPLLESLEDPLAVPPTV